MVPMTQSSARPLFSYPFYEVSWETQHKAVSAAWGSITQYRIKALTSSAVMKCAQEDCLGEGFERWGQWRKEKSVQHHLKWDGLWFD